LLALGLLLGLLAVTLSFCLKALGGILCLGFLGAGIALLPLLLLVRLSSA
jgi:hypothetical protein